eukprot:5185480-Pleurochrysis_carterae.AAC.2
MVVAARGRGIRSVLAVSGEAGQAARTRRAGHSRLGQRSRCVSTTAEIYSESNGSRPGSYEAGTIPSGWG